MSECSDERIGLGGNPGQPSLKIPLSSIKSVIQMIKCAFKIPEIPLPTITAKEISLGVRFRPGISKIDILSRVLTKNASVGINIGPNNDGSENKHNIATRIIIDEVVDAIKNKAVARAVIPIGGLALTAPGDITLTTTAGPVTGTIFNIKEITCDGIIS